MSRTESHIPALDGVRGVAVLLVLLFHFYSHFYQPVLDQLGQTKGELLAGRAIGAGWAGVDLFFVLSGFLITGILDGAKGRPGYFGRFYTRRILRIFPLYYGVLAVVFGVLPLVAPRLIAPLVPVQAWAWCYVSNVGDALAGRWLLASRTIDLSHFWSLAIEEQFYLVWPTVILLTSRRGAIWLCGGLLLAALALRVGLTLGGANGYWTYVFTLSRMDGLATGSLIALVSREWSFRPLERVAPYVSAAAIVLLLAIGARRHAFIAFDPLMATVGFSALALLFGCAIVSAATVVNTSLVGRLWTLRPLRFLGKYSYALYVLHVLLYPLFRRLAALVPLNDPISGRLLGIVLCIAAPFALSIAAALLSWHLIEKRCLALKDRLAPTAGDRPVTAPGNLEPAYSGS